MPLRKGMDIDIEIGTLTTEQGPYHPQKDFHGDETERFVVPGSEDDETYEHDQEVSKDLESHIKASELDHPHGSVKMKHLEGTIRAFLENVVQGDDTAVFSQKNLFKEDVTFEKAVNIAGTFTVTGLISNLYGSSTSTAQHKIYIQATEPASPNEGDIWYQV